MVVARVVSHAGFSGTFRHPVKFDGTNYVECRLSPEEQHKQVGELALHKPHVFLERYGTMLAASDLVELRRLVPVTPECQYWLDHLERDPPSACERAKKARRRRWVWARDEMLKGEGFFSEDEMRHRAPEMYRSLVGCYIEPTAQMSAPMQGSLSSYLMRRLEDEIEVDTDGMGAEEGAGAADVSCTPPKDADQVDDSLSDASGYAGDKRNVDVASRRAQFLKEMRNRFVQGEEAAFDYDRIDGNSEYDDLAEIDRDAEERYFDEM